MIRLYRSHPEFGEYVKFDSVTGDTSLLSAEEFEWLVGELFRREGWKVEETGRQESPDGSIDLDLVRAGEIKPEGGLVGFRLARRMIVDLHHQVRAFAQDELEAIGHAGGLHPRRPSA